MSVSDTIRGVLAALVPEVLTAEPIWCECNDEDYVVINMERGEQKGLVHRCCYTVQCTKCRTVYKGHADEIPRSRHDNETARELVTQTEPTK